MKSLLLASVGPLALACTAFISAALPARAQIALSTNDNKLVLENGQARAVRNAAPDTLSVIDLSASPPVVRAEIPVPASVVGPPLSVALTPDERLALVTANQVPDPANPGRTVPGSSISVVDLAANPPKVIATVQTGAGPAGVSINRAGTMALVANRAEGTVSAYRIHGQEVSPLGKVEIGPAASLVSHVAFTTDGRHALVTRYGDHRLDVLRIEGDKVTKTDREMTPGVQPYGLAMTPDGHWAVVANIGRGTGDADTVSLVDLSQEPFRIVDTVSVGQTPEGIMTAPDSRHVAVTVMNGSNKPQGSPFHGQGLVKLLRIENGRLFVVSQAPVGTWSQGAAFSPDGRTLLVGNMVEKNISVLRVGEDGMLTDTGTHLTVSGGSAALRTAERPAR